MQMSPEQFEDLLNHIARILPEVTENLEINIGGEEFRSVHELSDLILKHLGKNDDLVTYLPEDKHNVQNKRPDISKAKNLFGHNPQTTLEQGVPETINWMKKTYNF